MTPETFLQSLLATQGLSTEQERELQAHKKEVTDFLRAEFGNAPTIKYAGSREKGTMIAHQYDLDIVCYFPSSDTRSLKEIRQDVATHLEKKYTIHSRASAERITHLKGISAPDGYHIDVVPGRFIEGTKDVFLHVGYGEKERIQTNLKTHIDHIVNSGCVPVIRLMKLWACRNNIGIKTFILELFVVRALSGSRDKANLTRSFRQVIETLNDDFGALQLIDPANTNNVVSRSITPPERGAVVRAASDAMDKIGRSDDVSDWRAVFCESSISAGPVVGATIIRDRPNQGFSPRPAWSS